MIRQGGSGELQLHDAGVQDDNFEPGQLFPGALGEGLDGVVGLMPSNQTVMSAAVKSLWRLSSAASPVDAEYTAVMRCDRRMARSCLPASKPRSALTSVTIATRLDKIDVRGWGLFWTKIVPRGILPGNTTLCRTQSLSKEGVTVVYILWSFSDGVLSCFVDLENQPQVYYRSQPTSYLGNILF